MDENRFAHLLKPIRDLADNWNIDIANELEDYLEDLQRITISLDRGISKLNFAEAALVIQGSSLIYSKKVEYLYSLVFQTFEMLGNVQIRKGKKRSKMDDDDDNIFREERFLLLDDIFQADGDGIDLVDKKRALPERTPFGHTPSFGMISDKKSIVRTPLSLMGSTMKNAIGEKTATVGSSSSGFRLSSTFIDENGVLLLQPSSQLLVPKSPKRSQSFGTIIMNLSSDSTPMSRVPLTPKIEQLQQEADLENKDEQKTQDELFGDAAGFDDNDMSDYEEDAVESAAVEQESSIREFKLRSPSIKQLTSSTDEDAVPIDPWKPLDPHLIVNVKENPIITGNTVKIPKIIHVPFQKSSEAREKSNPLGPCYLKDVKKIHEKVSKMKKIRRAKQIKKFGKRVTALNRATGHGKSATPIEAEEPAMPIEEMMEMVDDDPDNDLGFDFDDDATHIDVKITEAPRTPSRDTKSVNMDDFFTPNRLRSSYEDLCRQHIQAYLKESSEFQHDSELTVRISQWQDYLNPVLEEEEQKPVFDIDNYGKMIVNAFHEDTSTMKIESLIPNPSVSEICRTFLTTLMLANFGNVAFEESNGTDTHVKLLTRELPFEATIAKHKY